MGCFEECVQTCSEESENRTESGNRSEFLRCLLNRRLLAVRNFELKFRAWLLPSNLLKIYPDHFRQVSTVQTEAYLLPRLC